MSGRARVGSPPRLCARPLPQPKATTPSPGLEATLQERLALYQTAIETARQAGDGAKMRRYDRGLKVSGQMGGCWDLTTQLQAPPKRTFTSSPRRLKTCWPPSRRGKPSMKGTSRRLWLWGRAQWLRPATSQHPPSRSLRTHRPQIPGSSWRVLLQLPQPRPRSPLSPSCPQVGQGQGWADVGWAGCLFSGRAFCGVAGPTLMARYF